MAIQTPDIVSWPANLCRRLYEPLAFLCCLLEVTPKENRTTTPDLEGVTDKGPKEAFRCFVNKLAQVCDNERGGNTVTAFSVLLPGSVEYRFASNKRDSQSLNGVANYVTDLLETLGNAPNQVFEDTAQRSGLYSRVLGKVLAFNRPRILVYLRALVGNFDFCIEVCEGEATPDSLSIAEDLESLKLSTLRTQRYSAGSKFVEESRNLLQIIGRCYQQDRFKEFMREKTREDREEANKTPWTELYHALGRLHSYSIAVNVFFYARLHWRELFEAFEVTYIPSSKPTSNPTPSLRRSASGMIKRLANDREVLTTYPDVLESYRQHSAHLQSPDLDLDTLILKKTKPKSFSPTVHAEVNLSHSLLREQHLYGARTRFFNEPIFGRYIGASKPTCRLCDLYFHAPSAPGFEVRRSHGNAYYNWGYPDVYAEDGAAALQMRKAVLEWMVLSVKHLAAKTVVERFVVGRRYDTLTTTDQVAGEDGFGEGRSVRSTRAVVSGFGGGGGTAAEVMDDLASMMGQVNLDVVDFGQGVSSAGLESDGEEDGEDGGARL